MKRGIGCSKNACNKNISNFKSVTVANLSGTALNIEMKYLVSTVAELYLLLTNTRHNLPQGAICDGQYSRLYVTNINARNPSLRDNQKININTQATKKQTNNHNYF